MDRYRVIANFAKKNNWSLGLELGVWIGTTTFFLMRNTDLKMICVDAWEQQNDNPEYDWQYNKKPRWLNGHLTLENLQEIHKWDHNKNEQQFRQGAKQWGDRIKIIKSRSLEIVDQIADESLDFIFHDSDHAYPFVRDEIKAFWPKLKPGGYAMGDDFNWGTVSKSVNEAFEGNYSVVGKGVWYSIK